MPFRSTGQLGPELDVKYAGTPFWDPVGASPSPRLGNTETGTDGHDYTWVQAAGTLAAGATFGINETTWQTAAGSTHAVPAAITGGVVLGDTFWARKVAL